MQPSRSYVKVKDVKGEGLAVKWGFGSLKIYYTLFPADV
jgi:hypothetical protein